MLLEEVLATFDLCSITWEWINGTTSSTQWYNDTAKLLLLVKALNVDQE